MFKTEMFRDKVRESGVTYRHIAKCLGITPQGLSMKVTGKSPFRLDEVQKIKAVLHLSSEDVMAIFFADDVA